MSFYDPIFFDTSKPDDLDLLHSSVRNNEEVSKVVANVEYEVLDYYKQRPSIPLQLQVGRENLYNTNQVSVRLLDYNQDDPASSTQELKNALKKTIAEITSWVIRNYDNQQNVTSIQQGKRSISFYGLSPSWQNFPSGWQRWLKNFDDREARYSI
jgi:hypothetical protein